MSQSLLLSQVRQFPPCPQVLCVISGFRREVDENCTRWVIRQRVVVSGKFIFFVPLADLL